MSTINWDDVVGSAAKAFEPLQKGPHNFRVKSAKAGMTKSGEKEQITLQLEVIDGPDAGKTAWKQLTLSPEEPKAMAFFINDMRALGIEPATFVEMMKTGAGMARIADAVLGVLVSATVDHRTWGGQIRDDIGNLVKMEGSPAAAVANTAPPAPAAPPAPPVPPASTATPEVEGAPDDLPF